MSGQFSRTQLLYGETVIEYFASCRVAVFGLGGVGGYVVEGLARSGIGALDLIDSDRICLSNLNRQILATRKTLGMFKVDAARERIEDIFPECRVKTWRMFYLPGTQNLIDFREYDYVVDAIDTVTGKLAIIENAKKAGVRVISSMGTGNKVNPAALEVADLYETSVCPLAKVMRRECRKRGIDSLKVVYSREYPVRQSEESPGSREDAKSGLLPEHSLKESPGSREDGDIELQEMDLKPAGRRSIPGSTAFVPSTAGFIIAGEVINDLAAIAMKG